MVKQTKSYRELMTELDEVLESLNGDSVDVDEALKLYEKGVALTKQLTTYLEQAENTLSTLRGE
jgi:exodeoxyribonuclease VII small subunit